MIVGWQLASHMRTDLVLDALKMALHRRGRGADVELVQADIPPVEYEQQHINRQATTLVGATV